MAASRLTARHPPLGPAVGAVLFATTLLGCSAENPPAAIVTKPEAGTTTGSDAAAWTVKPLGCGSAGFQSVAAVSGSTVGFASLAQTTNTQTCTIMPLGPVEMSQVHLWNVCYAMSDASGNYTSQIVSTQPYLAPTGVGLAFDSNGNANVAFTGVGSTPPMETCGSNDVFFTTRAGGTFSAPTQISNGSASAGLVAAQASECAQNICGQGDTTGFWPAIGFDPSGTAMMPFRDTHFGFAMDDYAKSDVELAEGTGGSYLTIDVSRGGGQYNRIAFTPAGLPAVLQYDQTGQLPGVWLDMQLAAGGLGVQEAAGGWTAVQLSTGQINEGLGFAISPQGLFAAAYYDKTSARLLYTDSKDGKTWSAATQVDVNGFTGQYPSLAFDSSGNPAIAYYRCNDVSAKVTQCDPSTDGLLLARRSGTTWTPEVVHADPSVTDGLYPALAFVNGKAVIAYQVSSVDAISRVTTVTWWVAEEP